MHTSGNEPAYTMGAVSEKVTRQQKSACQSTGEVSSQHVLQSVTQCSSDVQATGTTHSNSSLDALRMRTKTSLFLNY